ncbi:MAG TPA: hypothetical protein DEP08_02870 [Candidatus Jacksonbacteria bacterium]|nr:hypothetical protein [Candidatus Jacksonbacteria bacterium]HCE86715.1 hypothetical protein [Candidatus Jacksonbacteria bacterium]
MPKLPVIAPRQLISALNKIGFFEHRQHGTSHLVLKHPDGRRAIVPMHNKDIPKGTLLGILRDCEINKQQLIDLL